MTEREYRSLEIDSYSTIKDFLEDRRKYYKKYILKETVREEDNPNLIFGSLVDCLRFTPQEYDNRFTLAVTQVPTGQYKKLVDELMRVTLMSTNEHGEVTREVENMLEDAYNRVKFDRNGTIVDFKRDSFEVVKSKFIGTDLETYYRQLREAYGKQVIEMSTLENAQAILTEINSNFVTRDVLSQRTDSNTEVYDQFPIVGEIDGNIIKTVGYQLKCLVDRLIIDHANRAIYIYDLKTCWDNEGEFMVNYFKFKYYIQLALYFYLVVEWKKKQKKLEGYAVHYPKFIAVDSKNYKNPLIYEGSAENFQQGMKGFIRYGKYYPGVIKAVHDLSWHKEMGIWNISKDNYINKGKVKIRPFE
jgi:hypothetical protein